MTAPASPAANSGEARQAGGAGEAGEAERLFTAVEGDFERWELLKDVVDE